MQHVLLGCWLLNLITLFIIFLFSAREFLLAKITGCARRALTDDICRNLKPNITIERLEKNSRFLQYIRLRHLGRMYCRNSHRLICTWFIQMPKTFGIWYQIRMVSPNWPFMAETIYIYTHKYRMHLGRRITIEWLA